MPAMAQVGVRRGGSEASAGSRPRLERSRSDRVIAGVAAGIGQHLGIEPIVVRLAFVALTLPFGFGIVVYLLAWLLAPEATLDPATTPRPRTLIRPTRRQFLGAGLILAGILVLLLVSGFWFGETLAWPVSLAAIGFAILWARSGEERHGVSPFEMVVSGRRSIPRVAIGTLLILGAILCIVGIQLMLTGLLAEMISAPRAAEVPYSPVIVLPEADADADTDDAGEPSVVILSEEELAKVQPLRRRWANRDRA